MTLLRLGSVRAQSSTATVPITLTSMIRAGFSRSVSLFASAAVHCIAPRLGSGHIRDQDLHAILHRGEVPRSCCIQGSGVQHHQASLWIGVQPMAPEHTHDEARGARYQQCHDASCNSKPIKACVATAKSSRAMASSGL